MKSLRLLALLLFFPLAAVPSSFAWGSKGHTMINHLAVEALPDSVPAFLRSPPAIDEITYLGPEPDRWRSPAEPELDAAQAPDHFIDLELADLLGTLPRERYQYIAAIYAYGLTHPRLASKMQPDRIGFQPYITEEVWERLKSAMRNYRQLSAAHQDTRPVEAAIIFYAGWLGHYVGDGSQPLHTTVEYNGWVGPNPNGYTTDHQIHWQFETQFVNDAVNIGDVQPLMTTLQPIGDEWTDYLAYLHHTNSYVDEVYQLYKEHGFDGTGTAESRHFTAERLAAGASMLRDLIVAAWVKSAQPVPEWHHEEAKTAPTSGDGPAPAAAVPQQAGPAIAEIDPVLGPIYKNVHGVIDPVLLYAPDPEFTSQARKKRLSGTVVVSAFVGTDGHTHDVKADTHLGTGLDENAVRAVQQYRFRPATYHGKPLALKIKIGVNFGSY
jgi:TonB family protein